MSGIRAKLIIGDTLERQVIYVSALVPSLTHLPYDNAGTITIPQSIAPSTLFVPLANGDDPTVCTLIFFHNDNPVGLKIRVHYRGDNNCDNNGNGNGDNAEQRVLEFDPLESVTVGTPLKHICNHIARVQYEPLTISRGDTNTLGLSRGAIVASTRSFNSNSLSQAKSSYTPPLSMTEAPAYISVLMQMMQSIDTRLASLEQMMLADSLDNTSYLNASGQTISTQHITLTVANANTDAHTLAEGQSLLLVLTLKHGNISMTFQMPCDIVRATRGMGGTVWLKCSFWEMGAEVAEELAKYIFYQDRIAVRALTKGSLG